MLGVVRGFCVTVVETLLSALSLSLREAHLKRSMWSLVRPCGALSMEHTLVQASALLQVEAFVPGSLFSLNFSKSELRALPSWTPEALSTFSVDGL